MYAQSIFDATIARYRDELEEAVDACLEAEPGKTLLTAILCPDHSLVIGPRAAMAERLRETGGGFSKLADHIEASEEKPDGYLVKTLVHVILLPEDTNTPIVGTMRIWSVTHKGGQA